MSDAPAPALASPLHVADHLQHCICRVQAIAWMADALIVSDRRHGDTLAIVAEDLEKSLLAVRDALERAVR